MDKEKLLKRLYSDLMEFKLLSAVGIDPRKTWVLSDDEFKALNTVIHAVWDCREMGGITEESLKDIEPE